MNSRKNSSTDSLKTEAKALRKYLTEQGLELGHSKCLEAVAQMHGYKNWDTVSAEFEAPAPALFTVSNHHTKDCGPAPAINGDVEGVFSYLGNDGGQAVFHWDRSTKRGTLRLGDHGWENPIELGEHGQPPPTVVLTSEERLWLSACLQSAGVSQAPGTRTMENVRQEMQKFFAEHGRAPTLRDMPSLNRWQSQLVAEFEAE